MNTDGTSSEECIDQVNRKSVQAKKLQKKKQIFLLLQYGKFQLPVNNMLNYNLNILPIFKNGIIIYTSKKNFDISKNVGTFIDV